LNPVRRVPTAYRVSGAPAGSTVELLATANVTGIRAPFPLFIAKPFSHVSSAVADASGSATFDLTFPAPVGQSYNMQALVPFAPRHWWTSKVETVTVAPPPPPAQPCTLSYTPSLGLAPAYSRVGVCELGVDGPRLALLVFRDAPLNPFAFNLESTASWNGYAAGGGGAAALLNLVDLAFASGSTGTFGDFPAVFGQSFGAAELMQGGPLALTSLDTATSTFALTAGVELTSYGAVYPPPVRAADPTRIDLTPVAAGTETGTLTLSGGYTLLTP